LEGRLKAKDKGKLLYSRRACFKRTSFLHMKNDWDELECFIGNINGASWVIKMRILEGLF